MKLLKISAVSYLNTFPFVFGLLESGFMQNFKLELDVPSVCAQKLKSDAVDIALVPVAALNEIGTVHFISDFCIGAVGEVKTVLLLSKVPLEQISHIHLDFDSRTSVELVKVLAKHHWGINPQWENLGPQQSTSFAGLESLVAIGDKTFEIRSGFPYVYDLAEAWIDFTGLPFVFAVWVSRKILPGDVLSQFSQALGYGITHKGDCIEYFRDKLPRCNDCLSYLEQNISYEFDKNKKEGLRMFLSYLEE
ncbi:MAG: menaquinone biosynthesis protein [Bacteroidetes bacterium]|nr:menaquinone biosynthesis protein [Bacteroidota bacterium]